MLKHFFFLPEGGRGGVPDRTIRFYNQQSGVNPGKRIHEWTSAAELHLLITLTMNYYSNSFFPLLHKCEKTIRRYVKLPDECFIHDTSVIVRRENVLFSFTTQNRVIMWLNLRVITSCKKYPPSAAAHSCCAEETVNLLIFLFMWK